MRFRGLDYPQYVGGLYALPRNVATSRSASEMQLIKRKKDQKQFARCSEAKVFAISLTDKIRTQYEHGYP